MRLRSAGAFIRSAGCRFASAAVIKGDGSLKTARGCALAYKIEDYLEDVDWHRTSLVDYLDCPATTFLIYVNDAYDAFQHCRNKFTKLKDGKTFNKDSRESLQHISSALFATIMGHFETYQKSLFAGLIDRSATFEAFNIDDFLKNLKKAAGDRELQINSSRMLSLRGAPAQIGYVVADSIGGWQDPNRVNAYFKSFNFKRPVFSNDILSEILTFWQLRHSIVHTGAWLTKPDAQKVAQLSKLADKPIIFQEGMINWFSRKIHQIVKNVNSELLDQAKAAQGINASNADKKELIAFLNADSSKKQWIQ
jgi:hypothetical protein